LRAADTNVILRLVTGDDPRQEAIAREVIARETLWVPFTVVLECEWVLRSYYKLTRAQIASALGRLSHHPGLRFADAAGVRWALDRYVAGADFDDAIHLLAARSGSATALATFDGDMAGEVGPTAPVPIDVLA
jgi:predicted nucleic-acid-binding protein